MLAGEPEYQSDEQRISLTAGLIEKTLAEFGIPAKVVGYQVGPTVTQFAVEPGFVEKAKPDSARDTNRQKVRVSQISALSRDLALALSAERLRIEAPVPGRSYVGIEVPNPHSFTVRLRPLLETNAFYQLSSPLAMGLGRAVSGQPVVADLARLPHLLIAGATGSGKTVCTTALITCLAMNNSPEELRLVLIDPKMVDLVRFNGLPHLLGRVETDIERIQAALRWTVAEMDRRYQLLEASRSRNLDTHNRKVQRSKGEALLPRIVVVIDELADLMLTAPEQTEHSLVRLAQMARATGIHLVVATQRPSTDVVTGLIKANFPARIAFAVASTVDSRVILDTQGAEVLLGRGDMLFLPPEAAGPIRCQGVMVADLEVERVIDFWQNASRFAAAQAAPWEELVKQAALPAGQNDLVRQAITIVRTTGRASAALLQRRLRIGYPRAARLIDELEDLGVVGPAREGREREILMGKEELDAAEAALLAPQLAGGSQPSPGQPPVGAAPEAGAGPEPTPSVPQDLIFDELARSTPLAELDQLRAQMIEETLTSFGAPGKVVEINHGPTITQFGVEPGFLETRSGRTRVRVSKITALADDLALALSAPRIRIQAPVPGKNYVGIEVPNADATVVPLRRVIESDAYLRLKSPLRFGLGEGVTGNPIVADLAALPHLLIAGATGSGKTVFLHSLLACLLLENSPENLRLIMVDPKRVELTGYNGLPHLLAPVVVEMEKVLPALQWVTREMDLRYRKLAEAGARNIQDYNTKAAARRAAQLPFLIVIIDELADLMMLAPDETERTITRLAQLARATGIHLVIATQRPSVDIMTGLIKANFPARIAFAVASGVDSRVILDQPGAERLLGRGDMLFMAPDAPAPVRLQAAYVSDQEIQRLVEYWQARPASADSASPEPPFSAAPFNQLLWDDLAEETSPDPLLAEAIELARRQGRASVSMLQRRLRIGYTRAARLIEVLEARGIVGPPAPNTATREVLDKGETSPDAEEQ